MCYYTIALCVETVSRHIALIALITKAVALTFLKQKSRRCGFFIAKLEKVENCVYSYLLRIWIAYKQKYILKE